MNSVLWNIYQRALLLLPPTFHYRYAEQMLQTAHDGAADHPRHLGFAFSLFRDLAATTLRENMRMFTKVISRRPFFYQALCLSAVAFFLALGGYVVMQQTIRRAANQPQRQMADDVVRKYTTYDHVSSTCSPSCTDLSTSLQPFTIAYDENLKVINSDAVLNGVVPTPPPGVFENARRWGGNELTWQPRRDVRLAIVVRHFTGAHYSGFVLVGRSLATAEQGELIARWTALLGWLGIVCLLTLSATVFSRAQRKRTASA
jgi:hypothetical protein